MKFILEQTEENITTHTGLPLVGLLVSKTSLKERLNETRLPGVTAPEISHGDVAVAYLGLLCQGKSDFDSSEPFREEPFLQWRWVLNIPPPLQSNFAAEAKYSRSNSSPLKESGV